MRFDAIVLEQDTLTVSAQHSTLVHPVHATRHWMKCVLMLVDRTFVRARAPTTPVKMVVRVSNPLPVRQHVYVCPGSPATFAKLKSIIVFLYHAKTVPRVSTWSMDFDAI